MNKPTALCINLDYKVDQYECIKNEFGHVLNIERVSAIDAKKHNITGVQALFNTTIQLFENSISSTSPYLIIIEDDIYKCNNFDIIWPKILTFINTEHTWDFISLDNISIDNGVMKSYNEFFYKATKIRAAGFMIYNTKFIKTHMHYLRTAIPLDFTMKHNDSFIQLIPRDVIVKQILNKYSTTALCNTFRYEHAYVKTAIKLKVRFNFKDIHIYLLNWSKVTHNTIKLLDSIHAITKNVWVVNSDENYTFDKQIKLDDSHYYGSQFNHAIKHVQKSKIFCVIVGDTTMNDFTQLYNNALDTFNAYDVGVYAPNDKRTTHNEITPFNGTLFNIKNTDCGFWFIHPFIVNKMRLINYTISRFGWGIDKIFMKESIKNNKLILRNYADDVDQLNHDTNYNTKLAKQSGNKIVELYDQLNLKRLNPKLNARWKLY